MQKIVRYLKELEIELFVVIVVTVWLVGTYGFITALDKAGSIRDIADALYLSLQLFFVNSGAVDIKRFSWSFEFARWGAPLCLAVATIRAVLMLAKENTNRLRLRFIFNHVIVCGVGQKGSNLVADLLDNHKELQVVIVEIDPANTSLDELKEKGAIVIIGDAADPAVLIKAKLHKASTLIALTSEDKSNLQIAQIAYELKKPEDESSNQLACFIHLYDAKLRRHFYSHELFAQPHLNIDARLFSFYEKAARKLLQEHFAKHQMSVASSKVDISQHHLLLIGFGWLGKSLATQAARIGCYPDGRRLSVTVVDKRAEFLAQKLYQEIPAINQLLDIRFYAADVELLPVTLDELFKLPCFTPGHQDLNSADHRSASMPVDIAFLGLGDELLNYVVARDVATWFIDLDSPPDIIMCLTDKLGMARLVDKEESRIGKVLIRPYELLEKTSSFDSVVNPQLEILARIIHYDYVRNELAKLKEDVSLSACRETGKDGRDIWLRLQTLLKGFENISMNPKAIDKELSLLGGLTGNSSVVAWNKLPQELKDTNREQAEHVAIKLGMIGCTMEEAKNKSISSYEMTEKEVEMLARVEHARWVADKVLQGWTYGKAKDGLRKTNPLLLPYDDLNQAEKDKDINAVRNISKLVGMQGKIIVMLKTIRSNN